MFYAKAIIVPIRLRAAGVVVGRNTRFYGMPIVSLFENSTITIGDRVVFVL